ncbi:hypothetical protein D3C84_968520 [compost metagenome]
MQQALAVQALARDGQVDAAHWPHPFVTDLQCMQAGVPAKIIAAQGQVDATAGKVDGATGSHQVQVNIGMGGMEGRQPRDQPFHRDGRLA